MMGRVLFLGLWSALAPAVQAQVPVWPTKQIRIVVPVLAGSFTDVAGRSIAAELSEQLGRVDDLILPALPPVETKTKP